jgi:uncharacterized protein YgbK (DUF1537 family)
MAETGTLILADDLTGANDTAIQFVKHGFSALVIPHPGYCDPGIYAGYDVISVNCDTRGMDCAGAYRTVRNILTRLKTAGLEGTCYKKVDSVLRGNPGAELAAVMDELDIPLAIAAPSFPANRSVLEQGMLKSGRGAQQTGINAIAIFADAMDKKVESIPLEKIRQGDLKAAEYILSRHACGIQVFVADAVTDEDLSIVCRISAVIEKPLILAGAAALADQIGKNMERGETGMPEDTPCSIKHGPALIIAGTRQGETAAQIAALSRIMSVPIIRFKVQFVIEGKTDQAVADAFDEAAEQMSGNPDLCIVAVESMFKSEIPAGSVSWNKADSDADSDAISQALGLLTSKLMNVFQFPITICTGGDTSLEVCKCLGMAGIQPLDEIIPGIPIGRIVGGECEGRYIITKSGRFGGKNALMEIMNYLGNLKHSEPKEKAETTV